MGGSVNPNYRYTACVRVVDDMPGMHTYVLKTLYFNEPLPGTDAKKTGHLWAQQFGHVVADELEQRSQS